MKLSGTIHSRVFTVKKSLAELAEEESNPEIAQAALENAERMRLEASLTGELQPLADELGEGMTLGLDEFVSEKTQLEGVCPDYLSNFIIGYTLDGIPILDNNATLWGKDLSNFSDSGVQLGSAHPVVTDDSKSAQNFTTEGLSTYLKEQGDDGIHMVSEFIYGQYLDEMDPDTLLIRLECNFRAAFVLAGARCATFYKSEATQGRNPLYTTEQLCRALLLKYLNNWSFRQTEEGIRTHLLNRWFVGFPVIGRTLDHSTLYNFEKWVRANEPRLLFNLILARIDEDFPYEREAIQYGDTFAMYSRAAAVSRTVILRQCATYLLEEIGGIYPGEELQIQQAPHWIQLFGPDDERREYFLSVPERKARDVETAQATYPALHQIRSRMAELNSPNSEEQVEIQKWLKELEKALHDNFELTLDQEGNLLACKLWDKTPKGSYTIGSAVDPDATFRNHGDKSDLGYNVNLAVTANFIREIKAYTGATPDGRGVASLAAEQVENLGFAPPMLAYDRAAGFPKYIAEVYQASQKQTQLVVRIVHQAKPGKFFPADFTLDQESHSLTCPNGVVSTNVHRSTTSDGWRYRFTKKQCTGCPLIDPCRGGKMTGHRSVTISDYAHEYREAIAFQQTDEFNRIMRNRSTVERLLSGVVRYNGGRQAKGYGLQAADFQVRMAAMAYNIKRWHTLTRKKQRKVYRIDIYEPEPTEDELWI